MRNSIPSRRALSIVASAALVFVNLGSPFHATAAPPTSEELLQRINSLEQEIKDLKVIVEHQQQQLSVTPPTSTAARPGTNEVHAAMPAAFVSAGPDGFKFGSGNSNFVINFHGLAQVDSRTFFSDDKVKGNDTFLLRRARPILSATMYKDFDFLVTPEFGGNTVQVVDAQANYRLIPELQLQLGKMKPPVGLEAQQAEEFTLFNERSIATDLVPYRDIGVELHGDLFGGAVRYAGGLFNGVPDYLTTTTNNDFDNNKSFDGRLFFQPFINKSIPALKNLGFGVAGTYQLDSGATNGANGTGLTQGYATDGQQKFFTYSSGVASTGIHARITPQAYYYWGPLSLMSEYVVDKDHVTSFARKPISANLQNTAWEVSGGYILTGEEESYNGFTPKHPFSPLNGQWGALQLVARFAQLDIDKNSFNGFADPTTSASQATAWSVGLSWYLNRNLRINADYSRTTFEGGNGPKATVTKQPEDVFFTRFQLVF